MTVELTGVVLMASGGSYFRASSGTGGDFLAVGSPSGPSSAERTLDSEDAEFGAFLKDVNCESRVELA